MLQSNDDVTRCLVCASPVTSLHLGMDVCRACSAFFKRAMVIGVEYPCKQGTRKCVVAKDGKFSCRRCRFDRCVSVGMEYDGPIRVRGAPKDVPLLHRVGKEFRCVQSIPLRALIERRRVSELDVLRPCGIRMPHPREEIFYVHVPASVRVYTIAVEEAVPFYENAFPTLRQLERREWEMIFKEFVAKLNLISSYYCGRKLWGSARTKVMCSAATCYDIEVPFDFYYPGATENKGAFKSSLRTHANDHIAIFLPIFERSKITETEFHALAALILSDNDLDVSERAQQLMDDIRGQIFMDLNTYYHKELALREYATRLGNLMSLNHAVQECCAIFKVFFQFYSTIFDTFMVNRSMERLLLGSS